MSFRYRLRDALETGVIVGVKWAIIVSLTLFGVSYVLGDYFVVRQRAENGQRAFEFIAAQQKDAAPKGPQ